MLNVRVPNWSDLLIDLLNFFQRKKLQRLRLQSAATTVITVTAAGATAVATADAATVTADTMTAVIAHTDAVANKNEDLIVKE